MMDTVLPLTIVGYRLLGVNKVPVGGVGLTLWFSVLVVLFPSSVTGGMLLGSIVSDVLFVASVNLTTNL